MFVDEALQQHIDRNAEAFGLLRQARFGFARNFNAHPPLPRALRPLWFRAATCSALWYSA
jgi:hypothetical protein